MKYRHLIGAFFSALITTAAHAADKPNILVIWGDDIGWYNPSCYHRGIMGYQTPNIDRLAARGVAVNPRGPTTSHDPTEPGVAKRVQRGGSFLCTDQYCSSYAVGARGRGDVSTGSNHAGFRCVQ